MKDDFDGNEVVFGPYEHGIVRAWIFELPLEKYDLDGTGYSENDAISSLRKKYAEWKDATKEQIIPLSKKSFSGVVALHIGYELHKKLSVEAFESKMSLNNLVNEKLKRGALETYKFDDITPYVVERGGRTNELISLFFHLNDIEDGEKVILQFSEDNLRDALGNHDEWGDGTIEYLISQDKGLLELFSCSFIKESVKKFLSSKIKRGGLHGIEKFECVAISSRLDEEKIFSIHRFMWIGNQEGD